MTVSELRTLLRQLTSMCFSKATVIFSGQSFIAQPETPLVTITVGSVQRPLNPPTKLIDGKPVAFYPATVPVQIDLYTNGKQTEIASGFTPIAENTAEDEMISFSNFLNSLYVIDWCNHRDIAIVVPNVVQDLSGLVHDTNYQFRAMLEITVYCTMTAIGYTACIDPEGSIKHEGVDSDGKHYEYIGGGVQDDDVIGIKPVLKPDINSTPDNPKNDGKDQNESLIDKETNGYFENVEVNNKLILKRKGGV